MSERLKSVRSAPLRATTLREETFHALRQAILTGRLAPGAHLNEAELAQSLGVSRNPVREAMGRLEEQGLVRTVPNQGAFVVRPTLDQLQEAMLVRAHLELLAASVIVHQADRGQLGRLAGLVDRMSAEARAGRAPDVDALGRMALLDATFHEELVACAGNESLRRTWAVAGLVELLFAYDITFIAGSEAARARHIAETAEQHRRLLDALLDGDPAQVEQAIKEHFTQPLIGGGASLDAFSRAILGW